MSAAEVNFTFNGLHCLRDFGCVYIADKTRTISPETERSEYSIAGVPGTVLMNDRPNHKPYTMTGTLVPMKTPATMQAAQQLARDVAAWLKTGRHQLCWDYEPMHCHEAEVTAAIKWNTNAWIDGGIAVTFTVQPYTRDLTPAVTQKSAAAGTTALLVAVNTVDPCPVSLTIKNTGSSPITRVVVADPAGHTVELSKNLSLAVGATLSLNMEPPIEATIINGSSVANALPHAVKFDQLQLTEPGNLTVTLSGPALVTATAWGCLL